LRPGRVHRVELGKFRSSHARLPFAATIDDDDDDDDDDSDLLVPPSLRRIRVNPPQATDGVVLVGAPAILLSPAQASRLELCADRCDDNSVKLLHVRLQI
jgi:hypothetical protein